MSCSFTPKEWMAPSAKWHPHTRGAACSKMLGRNVDARRADSLSRLSGVWFDSVVSITRLIARSKSSRSATPESWWEGQRQERQGDRRVDKWGKEVRPLAHGPQRVARASTCCAKYGYRLQARSNSMFQGSMNSSQWVTARTELRRGCSNRKPTSPK